MFCVTEQVMISQPLHLLPYCDAAEISTRVVFAALNGWREQRSTIVHCQVVHIGVHRLFHELTHAAAAVGGTLSLSCLDTHPPQIPKAAQIRLKTPDTSEGGHTAPYAGGTRGVIRFPSQELLHLLPIFLFLQAKHLLLVITVHRHLNWQDVYWLLPFCFIP